MFKFFKKPENNSQTDLAIYFNAQQSSQTIYKRFADTIDNDLPDIVMPRAGESYSSRSANNGMPLFTATGITLHPKKLKEITKLTDYLNKLKAPKGSYLYNEDSDKKYYFGTSEVCEVSFGNGTKIRHLSSKRHKQFYSQLKSIVSDEMHVSDVTQTFRKDEQFLTTFYIYANSQTEIASLIDNASLELPEGYSYTIRMCPLSIEEES